MLTLITFYIDEFKNWYCRIVTYIWSTNRSYNNRPLIVGYKIWGDLYWDLTLGPDCSINGILGTWMQESGMFV